MHYFLSRGNRKAKKGKKIYIIIVLPFLLFYGSNKYILGIIETYK